MTQIDDLKFRLLVVEELEDAKENYTYRQLSKGLGLLDTVLARYCKGHVLPSLELAKKIHEILTKLLPFGPFLSQYLKFVDGHPDLSNISGNIDLLRRAVHEVAPAYLGKRITKVMTSGEHNIPFATMLAKHFAVGLVIAREEEGIYRVFHREHFEVDERGAVRYLHVPRDGMRKYDNVLLASLLINDGNREAAMTRILRNHSKAKIAGVVGAIGIGDRYKIQLNNVNLQILYNIPKEPLQ